VFSKHLIDALVRCRTPAAAAALCATFAAAWWSFLSPDPLASIETYTTAVGEHRQVGLNDGTSIHLNTDTQLEVLYTDKDRTVSLLRGEAVFSVKHNVRLPFRVKTPQASVDVLSTEFDVCRREAQTTVSVISGVVTVLPSRSNTADGNAWQRTPSSSAPGDSHRLVAGDQITIGVDGRVGRIERPDLSTALQWREGRLVFKDTPLEAVATEFNRYNTVNLVVQGEALRARLITGTFSPRYPEALIKALQAEDTRIAVEKRADAYILRSP
jgi:transmembrane sensor